MRNIRYSIISALSALLLVAGCAPPEFHHEFDSGHYASAIVQCAPYARKVSGIELYGDAYSWWGKARHCYRRSSKPAPGAVLVLKRTPHMPSGHVAVVKDVIGPRKISITHSDWGNSYSKRRIIYDSMRVEDVSPGNDWSLVRFWNDDKNAFGFPYEAYGFIYPRKGICLPHGISE